MRTCDYLHQASSHFTDQGLRLPLRQLMGRLVLTCKSTEDLRGRAVRQLHKTGTLPQCKLAGGKSPLNPPSPPVPSGGAQSQRGQESAQSAAGLKTAGRKPHLLVLNWWLANDLVASQGKKIELFPLKRKKRYLQTKTRLISG